MLQDKRYGRRYYLKAEPNERATSSISYIAGFDMAEKRQVIDAGETASKAPQASVADSAKSFLKELTDGNWDPTFFRIAQAIVEGKEVDAILKVSMLRQTLEVGGRGSDVFELAFAKHIDIIKEADIAADANWLDPKDPTAPGERRKAEGALKALPDLAAAGKVAADGLAKLRQPVGKDRRWVGWLRRGPGGHWRCEPSLAPEQTGELLIATRRGFGAGVAFAAAGNVNGGVAKIEFAAGVVPVAGSPLFLAH